MITELKRLRARGLNLLHLKKIFLYPILYFRGASYNNEKYWSNRHKKYQDQHLATGDEGLSESENIKRSKLISDSIVSILKKHDIKAETLLDIGTGIGATLRPLASYLAPKKIIGTDIAQVNPQNIQNLVFVRNNIIKTNENIPKLDYDLITMINVIEHIVTKKELTSALENIKKLMKDKTKLLIAPIPKDIITHRGVIYAKSWNYKTVLETAKSIGLKVEIIDDAYNSFYEKSVLITLRIL